MRTIKVNIYGYETEINIKSETNDSQKIKNIVVRILSRRRINLNSLLAKNVNFKKCNCCDRNANYELDYNVSFNHDIIHFSINGIKYKTLYGHEKLYCGNCLKRLNSNSIEFVSKIYNFTSKEANDAILKRNKSPFYKTNYQNLEDYKKYQTHNEEWYINKFGENGKHRFHKNIIKFQTASLLYNDKKDSASIKHYIEKYGEEIGIKKRNERIEKTKINENHFIQKYGEIEGKNKYKDFCKKLSYANTLDAYKHKYGEIEGENKYKEWKNKCVCSLENFVKRYGEIIGKEKYKKWLIGITSISPYYFSKESENFFKKLEEKIPYKVFHGLEERFIFNKENNHIYFYDGYIKELNLIIEYDTNGYHPNPNFLTSEEIKKCRGGSYEKDVLKENLAIKNNYNFYRVFVKSKKYKNEELEKLINYINEYSRKLS